ncbi:MAG: LeuA family protein [Haloarculaceae archaeon]
MKLCDVTLRESEQMPGRHYTVAQKLEAGRALDDLGVPVIQAGFPVVSERDREAVRRLAAETDATIQGSARAVIGDVDAAIDAEVDQVSLFAPLSSMQLEHVMHKSREEVFERMRDAVDHSHDRGADVTLGLMDGFRTDAEVVADAFERFPDVAFVGIADTVGMRTPLYVEEFLSDLEARGVDLSRAGVHFHDDIGVSVANTLVADRMGVGKADVSVAALGERAGNTPLESLVVAADLERGEDYGLDRSALVPTCRTVLDALDEEVDPRKPILGEEVVKHESGIHTAAMLDVPATFEPYDPAKFGGQRQLVFGEETGRGAARRLLERVGRDSTDEALVEALVQAFHEEGPMGEERAEGLAREVEL